MLKLAIGEFQKIVQLAPNNPEDHLMLARLYAADHQSPQAEEQLAAARKIDPGSEETALIASQFYTDLGDAKRAIGRSAGAAGRRPDVAHRRRSWARPTTS